MCIIAVTRRGAPQLSQTELAALVARNPDGVGLAWAEAGRLHVWRQLQATADQISSMLGHVPDTAPSILHLRQATCGPVTLDQVQPLMVDEEQGLVFAHNGTLPGLGGDQVSDSQVFVRDTVAPACASTRGRWKTQSLLAHLVEVIPAGNRAVMLDRKGLIEVVHPEEGFFHRNMWLSNRKMRDSLEDAFVDGCQNWRFAASDATVANAARASFLTPGVPESTWATELI